MSDEGEKTCPLCAEEMDLTDQQLKPCKCGYEICVWCWHHIMDMAEKDDTEGRCPACRTPYNKEKIVGTTANCERLVAEMSTERKLKSQKSKSKTSEGRKQLSSVRVIQRNLVYIVGLPLNLADEEVLQRKEYFAQYGKVLKVSISRTAAGAIQHFANNTCSVYITYSKEEDAVRCIQSVHGFVLEGRSLRACFGTTKYCHAWLRNVPCSNPDCLYLHEIGSQEDSFTKDEVISAYTRSRVQQITGVTNNMQRRSGNVLPSPADEYCSNSSASSGKPISKSPTNNPPSVRGSPPNSSSGRSVTLPAAASWGMRASNSHPPLTSLACSNGPSKQKTDSFSGSMAFSTAVANTTQISTLHGDVVKKFIPNEEGHTIPHKGRLEPVASVKQFSDVDGRATAPETCFTPEPSATTMNSQLYYPPSSKDKNVSITPTFTNSVSEGCDPGPEKDLNVSTDRRIQNLCSDMSSMSVDRHPGDEHSSDTRHKSSLSDNASSKSPGNWGLQQYDADQFKEPSTSLVAGNAVTSTNEIFVAGETFDRRSELETQVSQSAYCEKEEAMPSIDGERLKDPEVVSLASYFSNPSQNFHHPNRVYSPQHEAYSPINFNVDPRIVGNIADKVPLPHASGVLVASNGYLENLASGSGDLGRSFESSYLLPSEGKRKHMERFEGESANITCNTAPDIGESSIISNILSLDCDAWDESLTSPQNLARLLGEAEKPQGSVKVSSSWKVQNSNQSRFSFARQEESKQSDVEPSISNYIGQVPQNRTFGRDFVENKDSYFDMFGNCNGFSSPSVEESDNFAGSLSHLSSNKPSVSRSQISAPPGFSVPSRAPPPGFTSHERVEQAFDTSSGNRFLDNSSSFRNPYQAPPTGNVASMGDIEFMDPAILAVGKGRIPGGLNNPGLDMRSNFSPQLSAFENEARLQLLAQRSLSMHQNLRFSDMGDNFSSVNDAYGIPSRIMEQSPSSNLSPFSQFSLQQSRNALMSNGHRDGWNEVQSGNDLGMADLLRTERLGFNKVYTNYDDSKFRMPSSGNLYNRTFGI